MYGLRVLLIFAVFTTATYATSARFSNLDRLLNRLDGSTESPAESEPPVTPGHRIRHGHWQQNQHEVDFEDDDDEDDDLDLLNEPQADIHQRTPFTTSVTRTNWKDKPSRKSMEKFFNTYRGTVKISGGEDDPKAQVEVKRHHEKVTSDAKCRIPQPRVVKVTDHYPSNSRTYIPSCTLLHQCAEDTGCCPPSQKCGPKQSQEVELYFYATYEVPGMSRHHPRKAARIEKLIFYNHTECECMDRGDEMPRDTDSKKFSSGTANHIQQCRCPSQFSIRIHANGSCACDCFDKQRDCTKFKKGKEYFSHEDRLCIELRTCTVPTCDFGAYIRRSGRCPRKHEKYRSWERYKI